LRRHARRQGLPAGAHRGTTTAAPKAHSFIFELDFRELVFILVAIFAIIVFVG